MAHKTKSVAFVLVLCLFALFTAAAKGEGSGSEEGVGRDGEVGINQGGGGYGGGCRRCCYWSGGYCRRCCALGEEPQPQPQTSAHHP